MKDTLKSPPPENQTMKKASAVAILLTTTLYLCCACFGYAALPGNLLTGFGFYEPQPLFVEAERWITKKLPDNEFVNNVYTIKLPMLSVFKLNLLRLCFRTTYVASTTGIALLFPYFNDVLGVLGALNFWPLAIYFPVEMYLRQRNIKAWTRMWVMFQAFRAVCLVVTIVAFVGSTKSMEL
ncbi:hypothetical protein ACSBR1_028444 [Camellia fascicularis]